ncbi:MAG TPA: hypothetical protein P5513_03295 [Candidatus Diapherotrites archaeon]|nr:hypothetical protein [Candidatus Diapherotrites archaeon]
MIEKIVKESLLEFDRGVDPMKALSLGGVEKIEKWLRKFVFKVQYRINPDYTIDIICGDFIVFGYEFRDGMGIPEYISFNECKGSFIINGKNLPDLYGCPKIVKGDFVVPNNKIVSLKGSPSVVGGDYIIVNNPVKFRVEDIQRICKVGGKIIV